MSRNDSRRGMTGTAHRCRQLLVSAVVVAAVVAWFAPTAAAAAQTMRVDYYHSGNDKQESFSLDRVVIEPLPWPGNPKRPLDTTNSGKYFFEVVDTATGATL